MPAELNDIALNLLSGFAGAGLGAWATWWTAGRSHNLSIEQAKRDSREQLCRMLQLVKGEIETAWQLFEEEYAAELLELQPEEPYLDIFPIGKNPFPVFDTCVGKLAELPEDLAAKIVRAYMRMKGMVTTIEMNNGHVLMAKQYARAELISAQKLIPNHRASPEAVLIERLNITYNQAKANMGVMLEMGGFTEGMRALTLELRQSIPDLLEDIDRAISNQSK